MTKPSIIESNKRRSKLWDEYLMICHPNGMKDQDKPVYIQFITLLAHYEEAQEEIDANGLLYESTDKDGKLLLKSNPAHKILSDTGRQLIAFYIRYGLSEWDRQNNEKRFQGLDKPVEGDFSDID